MTESLRVNEEVASLRAIVNTLRIRESFHEPACRLNLPEVMMNRPSPDVHRTSEPPAQAMSIRAARRPFTSGPEFSGTFSGSPPSSPPFSSYAVSLAEPRPRSPSARPALLPDDTPLPMDEDGLYRPRESILTRSSGVSVRSTSSQVSSRGRVVGRPMGIPPPESSDQPTAGSGRARISTSTPTSRPLTSRIKDEPD